VVIERLDVQTRKAELEAASPERARGLSALAYGKLQAALRAACVRAGVEVIEGNPAFTSPIGAVRYAVSRGLSVHQGAAVAIARRGWGLSERPAGREARVRLRRGVHVTLALPARTRARHVWTQWSGARRALKAAHHAQARSETAAARSAPGSPVRRGRRAIHAATVGSRGASPQPRSGGDVDFIPQLAE
jgi:IS605 OrfB family transposase